MDDNRTDADTCVPIVATLLSAGAKLLLCFTIILAIALLDLSLDPDTARTFALGGVAGGLCVLVLYWRRLS